MYRLAAARHAFDNYVESIIGYWYKKKFGSSPDFLYGHIKCDYNTYGQIKVTFENGEKHSIPTSEFYDNDPDHPKIVMLWYSDYYDGPLSGLATYNGKKVWYVCVEMDEVIDIRKFGIYELSDAELAEEEHWHGLFQELVGYHCDYGITRKERMNNDADTEKYFAMSKKADIDRDYTKNKLIGIYDECHMDRYQE